MKRFSVAAFLIMSVSCAYSQQAADPCTSAAGECTEWVMLSGDESRALVYRSYSLTFRNENISRALILVHGGARNADDYFRTGLAAAFLADKLQDTIVIAPRFAGNDGENCTDDLAENELNFPCEQPRSWRVGSAAKNDANVTSFDVVDEILRDLADNEAFPNLSTIVVAGHSGGGTFVTHYEMANLIHEGLGIPVTYVAANASYYAYLDGHRPADTAFPANIAATIPRYVPPDSGSSPLSFVPFSDAANCATYDTWPFGLQGRFGYSARVSDELLKTQIANRPTTYLVGSSDVRRNGDTCPKAAQGPNNLARGLAYVRHANERHGAQHDLFVVRGCGHNFRCMFTMDQSLPVLFPEE